jgi:hypothetical protein
LKFLIKGEVATADIFKNLPWQIFKNGGGGGNRNCIRSFRINNLQPTDTIVTPLADFEILQGIA